MPNKKYLGSCSLHFWAILGTRFYALQFATTECAVTLKICLYLGRTTYEIYKPKTSSCTSKWQLKVNLWNIILVCNLLICKLYMIWALLGAIFFFAKYDTVKWSKRKKIFAQKKSIPLMMEYSIASSTELYVMFFMHFCHFWNISIESPAYSIFKQK